MSLSNHESDKVSSATQTRVNVVSHRGGYARNWPLLPGNGGRADSQGGRESEKSCEECGLLLLVLGEKERTRELLLGKATSSTHPKLKQLQKRRIRRDLALKGAISRIKLQKKRLPRRREDKDWKVWLVISITIRTRPVNKSEKLSYRIRQTSSLRMNAYDPKKQGAKPLTTGSPWGWYICTVSYSPNHAAFITLPAAGLSFVSIYCFIYISSRMTILQSVKHVVYTHLCVNFSAYLMPNGELVPQHQLKTADDGNKIRTDILVIVVPLRLTLSPVYSSKFLGLCSLPGCRFKDIRRNLQKDIEELKNYGTQDIFVLCTRGELFKYRVPNLIDAYQQHGICVHHYPVPDGDTPDIANCCKILEELKNCLESNRKTIIQ
ncbi:Cdkn3 [Columba livia]|nr:Cdkn3 [Columba livia]